MKKWFKRLFKILLVLIIVVLVISAFSPFILEAIAASLASFGSVSAAALVTGLVGVPWYVSVGCVLGLAYTIDPETTTEVVNDAGELAGKVADEAGGVIGSAADGLLSKLWPWVLGFGALWLFASGDNNEGAEHAG